MRKLFFLIAFFMIVLQGMSQKVYFIYLQSENKTPFFVKMGERVHSSSASGYLILSNLVDSTYTLNVGFPKSKSEYKFQVRISREDRGFEIKTLGEELSLFDLQGLQLIKAQKPLSAVQTEDVIYITKTDAFTKMLSVAMDDPSLLLVPDIAASKTIKTGVASVAAVAINDVQIKDTSKAEQANTVAMLKPEKPEAISEEIAVKANADTIVAANDITETETQQEAAIIKEIEASVAEEKKEVVEEESSPEIYKRSKVTKRSESSTTQGFGLVFFDDIDGNIDTVRLLIPNPKIVAQVDMKTQKAEEEKPVVIATEEKPIEIKPEDKTAVEVVKNARPSCVSIATDKDFLKLRKNMAAEADEEAMLAVARKSFKSKCYSSEQMRNLSALFLSQEGKYNFFDAGYTHVIDPVEFRSLKSEIKDEYYSKRFLALVGE